MFTEQRIDSRSGTQQGSLEAASTLRERDETKPGYQGPERRTESSSTTRWLAKMLDEVDYGLLLLVDGSRVLHANHAARVELDPSHPLQLVGDALRVREAPDIMPLHEALLGARNGLRKLVTLGRGSLSVSVAVVPLGALGLGGPQATLLLMGRRSVCASLSVQMFGRCHGLTPMEARVLEALSLGLDAREVAEQHGVELTTVRTQIAAIRAKVGADSIGDVVRRVAVLPPMVGVLRGG